VLFHPTVETSGCLRERLRELGFHHLEEPVEDAGKEEAGNRILRALAQVVPTRLISLDQQRPDERNLRLEILAHRHGAVSLPREALQLPTGTSRRDREPLAEDLEACRLYVTGAHVVPFIASAV
jgi:hypothetical protein